jgi:glycosyltransferase involved in cell wall biosynthesis
VPEDASGLRVAIAYDCLFPATTGGGERVYRRIAESLTERGAAVDYVTRTQWPDGHPPQAPFAIVDVWSGEIHDAHGTRTTTSAIGFAWALFRYFRRHRRSYDLVIVAALPVLNVFAVRLALFGSRVRLVVDWLEVWPWRKWRAYSGLVTGTIAAVLQSMALRVGDILTVNSNFTRRRVLERRGGADPIVLGLLDLVQTAPLIATAPTERPFILFVGRHIADKRLTALPAALAVARRTIPTLHAVVVGTGPETEAARARADAEGLSGVIRFAGRVSSDELDGLFSTASALVNPSAREGFGLVVAEAAAFGAPSVVVAGEDNAAAELVTDGVNGFVSASTRPEALGAAIVAAVSTEGIRSSTLAWFEEARISGGLERSLDAILERYRASTTR